jgi:hypothetical protein
VTVRMKSADSIKELLTGHAPYHGLKNDLEIVQAITSIWLPPRPVSSIHKDFDEIWFVCRQAWGHDPKQRPTCSQLVTVG